MLRTTKIIRNYNKIYKDKHYKTPSIYNVGDYILVRNDRDKIGINKKLKSTYKGPYMITSSSMAV